MVHDLINMGQESHLVHFRARPFWTLFISYLWSWGLLAPFPFHLFLVLSPSRHFISALGPSGSTALEFWHSLPLLNSRVSVVSLRCVGVCLPGTQRSSPPLITLLPGTLALSMPDKVSPAGQACLPLCLHWRAAELAKSMQPRQPGGDGGPPRGSLCLAGWLECIPWNRPVKRKQPPRQPPAFGRKWEGGPRAPVLRAAAPECVQNAARYSLWIGQEALQAWRVTHGGGWGTDKAKPGQLVCEHSTWAQHGG